MKILNSDELMGVREDDLKKIILSLRSRIKDAERSSSSKDKKSRLSELQTYYCYVYRELEHRGIV